MVPFNLQLELSERKLTISAEQLDQLADEAGFMRYQIKTFNNRSVIWVNIEETPRSPLMAPEAEDLYEAVHDTGHRIGYSLDEVFTPDEVVAIAIAIRDYHSSRKLNFDQMAFDF